MLPLKDYIHRPSLVLLGLLLKFNFLFPDKLYLQLLYRLKMERWPNLKNPQLFTEKLQWLKLYNRKPEYTTMVDKYAVKEYVAGIIGERYIIPTLGVWDNPEDIDWDKLPDKFVLKTTHGGGGSGVVICKDKDTLNRQDAIEKLSLSMKQDIYARLREWPYKNVRKRIIAEKYMEDKEFHSDLPDYKFFCFNGEPKVVLVASNRFTTHNFDYYDMQFHHLSITSTAGNNSAVELSKPNHFEEMKELARKLSKGLPHARVDLYDTDKNIYFGEITFFDSSGFDNMSSDVVDMEWGSWITLPNK